MKQKDCTIIHVTREVVALSRAGQHCGVTNVAKLCGVTRSRARRVLTSAKNLKLVYTYNHQYRKNVTRVCYAATDLGLMILQDIADELTLLEAIEAMTDGK